MDKKGFTITELLASIVILGLLTTFATISVMNIMSRVNKNDYEKILKEIRVAAETYSSDTRKNLFFVADLINEGRLEATNGVIKNPLNKLENVNCFPIEVSYKNGNYEASITEEIYELDDQTCDQSKLINSPSNLDLIIEPKGNSYFDLKITCPTGYYLILSSNTGLNQIIGLTNNNLYSFNNILIKDATNVVLTLTLKDQTENTIESKSFLIDK